MDIHLEACLEAVVRSKASDLHIGAEQRPSIRVDGELRHMDDFDEPWSAAKTGAAVRSIVTEAEWERFNEELELDLSIDLDDDYRFRVNLYFDRQGTAAAFRLIPNDIVGLSKLGMPDSVEDLAQLQRGLVLVTGPTGSGKSTTLAALLDRVNHTRRCHILTIEDPIEFVHQGIKSVVNQREIGRDTSSFSQALRRALRQDPDVILVGELRDHETIQVALTAAETGHLVLSTLHTQDSVQTVDRIIDVFPSDQQAQIRTQLAGTLKAVVSQTLLRRTGGGRIAASEVLIETPAISNMIREGKTHMLYSAVQAGREQGMRTLDQHLAQLVSRGIVQRDDVLPYVKDQGSFRALENGYAGYSAAFTTR
ncbi:type IV pilus twitching motility protein PilT [Pseudoclavibacter sp. CFCC 11306]|nr:type IV pilus twitching motility protein PilT [Pseudoclavibacter sp. CFCC 11306]